MDKLAGLFTQISDLKKKLKKHDPSKNPKLYKETLDALEAAEKRYEEQKKRKADREKAKTEAAVQPTEVVKESAPEPTEEVVKESTVEKFAIDSKVEPIRGAAGSWGLVMREAGVNGDPLCYVKWMEGSLAQRDGYGGYYPSDLKLKAEVSTEAKDPTAYVPREQVYNLEADLKSKHEQMIKDLEEEHKTALEKGEAAWAFRLEEKLKELRKAYEERFPSKTAENGTGGTDKLKVVDFTPNHDKDPQEKSTGYGGDRAMGWQTAPKGEESSLPLESSLKKADLNTLKINVGSSFYNVTPLPKPSPDSFSYDIADSLGTKLFKIDAKQELNQEHIAQIIQTELANKKEAANKCAICGEEFGTWAEYDVHKKEKHGPKMAKLVSDLAFLKKGTLVSILSEDTNKKQVKFASLDNSLRGWAPSKKFSAFGDVEQKMIPHGDHQDEIFAEAGNEILVACPAGSTNISFRPVEAPPATPEALNPDVTASAAPRPPETKEKCKQCGVGLDRDEAVKGLCEDCEYLAKEGSLNIEARVVKRDDGWHVLSEKGKNLGGPYKSKEQAQKRLRQVEYFKHKGSLQSLSKKEADQDPILDLQNQVQLFKDRMNAVTERLSQPPTKTADVETKEDLSKVDMKDLTEGILHMIDMLETKAEGSEEAHALLEELENKVWDVELKLGMHPDIPEHEKAEPEHKEIVEEVKQEEPTEKESNLEIAADSVNTPPSQIPPAGFKYAWDPKNNQWILVQIEGATGGGGY